VLVGRGASSADYRNPESKCPHIADRQTVQLGDHAIDASRVIEAEGRMLLIFFQRCDRVALLVRTSQLGRGGGGGGALAWDRV